MRAMINKSTIGELKILKDLQYKEAVVLRVFLIKIIFDFSKTLEVSRKFNF